MLEGRSLCALENGGAGGASATRLGRYPIDLTQQARAASQARWWTRWSDRTSSGRPFRQAPLRVAEAALGYTQLPETPPGANASAVLRFCDWLTVCALAGPRERGLAWYTDQPLPRYELPSGWPSARTQGAAISALLRAFELSRAQPYLQTAVEAVEPLQAMVEEGGLARMLDGRRALETAPGPFPVLELTGWMTALWALHELRVVDSSAEAAAAALLAESLSALVTALPRYEAGWWTRATLCDRRGLRELASPRERHQQAIWLQALASITDIPELHETAKRWARHWPAHAPQPPAHFTAADAAPTARATAARPLPCE